MGIESNAIFLSHFQNKVRITIFSIPNILNKSSSSAFRPALSNLWLLLVNLSANSKSYIAANFLSDCSTIYVQQLTIQYFICSKLRQNLSEIQDIVRIQRVIWDHLLAFKSEIIQKQLYFSIWANLVLRASFPLTSGRKT